MEFFGKVPDKVESTGNWSASMWASSTNRFDAPDKSLLMIGTSVKGHVEVDTARTIEEFFQQNLKGFSSGLPDDLVVFHDWSGIQDLDVMKCRPVFSDLLRQVKPVQREIVFYVNLGGKFLGGSLIEAALKSFSMFYQGVVNKVSTHEEFRQRVGDLERKYGGRRFSTIPPLSED